MTLNSRCAASLKTEIPLRLFAVALLVVSTLLLGKNGSEAVAYQDPKVPIEVRIDDLMSRMSLKEKVGQLNLPCVYVSELGKDIPSKLAACGRFAAGTYTQEIGPGCGFFTLANEILHEGPRQQAEYFNELQKIALTQTRLIIPLLEDEEGTHGAMFSGATVFPEGLAIGSSFDRDLVRAVYSATAAEARSVGIHVLSTLVSELDRDPRMGRNEEAYTEDPYLYSQIIGDIVRAVQGTDIAAPDKAVALLTDFPTQSEPESGLERGAVQLSERSLRENYLLPWMAGISKAGALGVMAGYPDIEDVPAHASEKWTNDVLRQELGFRGVVVSEGGGFGTLVYENLVRTQKEAGALALKAGVDVDITYEPAYMRALIENLEEGRIPISLVDRAVRRVLELKFRLGLFEKPYVDVEHAVQTVHSRVDQELALRAGREGTVLLKNDHNLLPIKKNLRSIAIIGPNADNPKNQLGDYSPHQVLQHVVTIADGIHAKVGAETKVVTVKGCGVLDEDRRGFSQAIRAAKAADVAVVVVGENEGSYEGNEKEHATDGEGHDVASLDLTGVQEDLIKAVSETGTPTVVVLVNGRPLSIRWAAEHIPAIIEAWHPGERGGDAVADVLFGDFNPSGRLAITIPRHVGQLPAYYNYMPGKGYWINQEKRSYADMPATPLYPFGYGLSYSSYQYSNLHIEPAQVRTGGTARITMNVRNTGARAGVETVQLYLHRMTGPVVTPVKQLRGLERVELRPGETKQVTLMLSPEDLQLLDRDMRWRVVPGDVEIMVGRSSEDLPLKGLLEISD